MNPIRYEGGYRYQLNHRYEVHTGLYPPEDKRISTRYICLSKSGLLTIREGYAWDGPSGPTIHTKSFMRGSLEQDTLYQLMRLGLLPPSYREAADQRLRQVCLEDGMGRLGVSSGTNLWRKSGQGRQRAGGTDCAL